MQAGTFRSAFDDLIKLAIIGGAGFVVGKAANPTLGVTAGDWLSFAGAVVGVVLAIGGAVWIEDRKRLRERKEEFHTLTQSVALVRATFQAFLASDWENRDDRYAASVCIHTRLRAREAAAALQIAKASTSIKSIRLMILIHQLEYALMNDVLAVRKGDDLLEDISDEMTLRARDDCSKIHVIAEGTLEDLRDAHHELVDACEKYII